MNSAFNNMPERALLGHIVADPSLGMTAIAAGLAKDYFTDQDLGSYWESIKSLLPQSDSGLISAIHRTNPNATMAILGLVDARSDLNFESALEIVVDYGKKLRLFDNFSKVYMEISSDNRSLKYQDILQKIERFVQSNQCEEKQDEVSANYNQVLGKFADELEKKNIDYISGKPAGISTGINDLDEAIHGWMPKGFYVIGARTSMGKTTLVINFADAALKEGKKVLLFTNEMSDTQIAGKHLSLRTGINGSAIEKGDVNPEQINLLAGAIHLAGKFDFFINEKSGRSLVKFENEIKKMKRKHDIDLVILDYIQQLNADDRRYQSRVAELTEISARIKSLAIDLNIPIVCLAQLNRTAERSEEIPNISQIRDCGSIEQDADVVMLLHRNRNDQPNANGEVTAQIIVGKARFGETGFIPLMVNFALNKFR